MKLMSKRPTGAVCRAVAFPVFFAFLFFFPHLSYCKSSASIPVSVAYTCAPVISCVPGTNIPTQPGLPGNVLAVVHGADLVADASSACSSTLQFSVYRADEVDAGIVVPGPNQDSVILNCSQDCPGTIVMRVYVWDDNFNPDAVQPDGTVGGPNYAFCETYVVIDIPPFCECGGGLITISGNVRTETGNGVNHVQVSLSGDATLSAITDTSGYYAFHNLTPGGHYVIAPELDNFPQNGLSVADVVLISKHILGLQSMGSPYRMIAADVNNDTKITTVDLVHLRRLILNLDTEFAANTSWRFVWAGYDFPIPTNPWLEVFPEIGNFDFEEDTVIDFVAIKIGDVSNSANPDVD